MLKKYIGQPFRYCPISKGERMQKYITEVIEKKIQLLNELLDSEYMHEVESATMELIRCIKEGNKIMLAGNGGSAADAQHFAGEVIGRFMMDRASMPALSLCVDPSVMTCVGNDYGYDMVFARQMEGLAQEGDVFIAISTSGNSKNIINAIEVAKRKGVKVVGFLGKNGGAIKDMCDYALVVPSDETPRIQEIHTLTVHLMCEQLEKSIFA